MNVKALKPEYQREMLDRVLAECVSHTQYMSEWSIEWLLFEMVNALDHLDGEDTFGTEGWKHRFGLED